MSRALTIAVAAVFMMLRLFVQPETPTPVGVYKAAVHLFMGGLFVCCVRDKRAWLWWLFGVLSAWEVTVAVISRM